MNVSLERAGRFKASSMIPNAHKCAAMRTHVYHYFVRIDATDAKLTPEGFVMNNEDVQTYFDGRFGERAKQWDAVSCELLAIISAKELCKLLVKEGITIRKVLCRIKGSNGAWIEAECNPLDIN